MPRSSAKVIISSVCLWAAASSVLGAEWLLIHEVTSAQVNLYQQQSRYFVDLSSLAQGSVEGIRYELAYLRTESQGKKTSTDQVAVICSGISAAPALSVRKMGVLQADGAIKFAPDFGPPSSIADFSLTNLDRDARHNIFFLAAQAVCKHRKR